MWGGLEQHWNGTLLDTVETALHFAQSMTWRGLRPAVQLVSKVYHTGVRLPQKAMATLEQRLDRLDGLEKYFVSIRPAQP